MQYRVQYLPTLFPTDYDSPNVRYDSTSLSAADPTFWEWVMYNFGDRQNPLGQMQKSVEADSPAAALEVFRGDLTAELAQVLGVGTGEVGLYASESIPYRQGWITFGGPGTQVLYVGAPDAASGELAVLRTKTCVEVRGVEQPLTLVYAFLVTGVEQEG